MIKVNKSDSNTGQFAYGFLATIEEPAEQALVKIIQNQNYCVELI